MYQKILQRTLLLLVMVLTTQITLASDDGEFLFVNSWESGSYTLRQESFISLIVSSNKEVVSRDQVQVLFTWRVVVHELQKDGTQNLELNVSRVMLRDAEGEAASTYFDSSNELNNKPYVKNAFKRLEKIAFNVVLKNGSVQKVDSDEVFWKDLPEPKNEEEQKFYFRLQSLGISDNIRQIFESFSYLVPPEGRAKVNDTWIAKVDMALPAVGSKTMEWKYVFDSTSKQRNVTLANLSASGTMEVPINENTNASVKSELKAKVNVKANFPVEFNSSSTVSVLKKEEGDKPDTKIVGLVTNKMTVAKY